MNTMRTAAIAATMLVAVSQPATAEILLEYAFEKIPPATRASAAPSTTATGISGSDFAPTSAFEGSFNSSYGYSSSSGTFTRANATGATTADGDSLAEALAADYYWSFTIENTSSDSFTIDSLSLDSRATAATGYSGTISFFSSVDGFTAGDVLTTDTFSGPSSSTETLNFAPGITLAPTESIEYRFYVHDNSGDGNDILRFDQLTVNGNVVVPEPSSAGLLGLGALTFVAVRRRRKVSEPSHGV